MKKDLNPQTFSLSAVIIGYILTGDLSASESNAVGNWLMLVGQYLETFSAQQSNIESKQEKRTININSRQAKNGGSIYDDDDEIKNHTLTTIENTLRKMQIEINKLKTRGDL